MWRHEYDFFLWERFRGFLKRNVYENRKEKKLSFASVMKKSLSCFFPIVLYYFQLVYFTVVAWFLSQEK